MPQLIGDKTIAGSLHVTRKSLMEIYAVFFAIYSIVENPRIYLELD